MSDLVVIAFPTEAKGRSVASQSADEGRGTPHRRRLPELLGKEGGDALTTLLRGIGSRAMSAVTPTAGKMLHRGKWSDGPCVDGCAGRPAKGRRWKSVTVKE